ncbi:hypothetical protein KM043_013749 [Ampulex compressa]|nr:hypothetical protein KM043_013749 [Ampulex compressa]
MEEISRALRASHPGDASPAGCARTYHGHTAGQGPFFRLIVFGRLAPPSALANELPVHTPGSRRIRLGIKKN